MNARYKEGPNKERAARKILADHATILAVASGLPVCKVLDAVKRLTEIESIIEERDFVLMPGNFLEMFVWLGVPEAKCKKILSTMIRNYPIVAYAYIDEHTVERLEFYGRRTKYMRNNDKMLHKFYTPYYRRIAFETLTDNLKVMEDLVYTTCDWNKCEVYWFTDKERQKIWDMLGNYFLKNCYKDMMSLLNFVNFYNEYFGEKDWDVIVNHFIKGKVKFENNSIAKSFIQQFLASYGICMNEHQRSVLDSYTVMLKLTSVN